MLLYKYQDTDPVQAGWSTKGTKMKKIFGIVAMAGILFAGSQSMAEAGGDTYCQDGHYIRSAAQILVEKRDCGGNIEAMFITFRGEDITEMSIVSPVQRIVHFSLRSIWIDEVEVEFELHAPCQWNWETSDAPCNIREDLILARMLSAMVESDSDVVFTATPRFVGGFPCRNDGSCVESSNGEYQGTAAYSVHLEVVGATW